MHVFRADDGDCALFRIGNIAILIDGGKEPPFDFWRIVRRLPKETDFSVVLTHGDADHANGIIILVKRQLLIEEIEDGPRIGKAFLQFYSSDDQFEKNEGEEKTAIELGKEDKQCPCSKGKAAMDERNDETRDAY